MTTTQKTHQEETPADTTDGAMFPADQPAEPLKMSINITGVLSALEAARAIEDTITQVQAHTRAGAGGRSAAKLAGHTMAAVKAARAAEAQEALAEAARHEKRGAAARLKAAELEKEEPHAAYAKRAAIAARRAREDAERLTSAEGRFFIDCDHDDATNGYVTASPSKLIENGWHHKTVCARVAPGSAATDSPLVPDHELIRQAWQGMYDWHDEEHGNGLWHGCTIQPCAGVPAAFRAEPWHHTEQD